MKGVEKQGVIPDMLRQAVGDERKVKRPYREMYIGIGQGEGKRRGRKIEREREEQRC